MQSHGPMRRNGPIHADAAIRPTANGHAFEYADGTPYFMLGDT